MKIHFCLTHKLKSWISPRKWIQDFYTWVVMDFYRDCAEHLGSSSYFQDLFLCPRKRLRSLASWTSVPWWQVHPQRACPNRSDTHHRSIFSIPQSDCFYVSYNATDAASSCRWRQAHSMGANSAAFRRFSGMERRFLFGSSLTATPFQWRWIFCMLWLYY